MWRIENYYCGVLHDMQTKTNPLPTCQPCLLYFTCNADYALRSYRDGDQNVFLGFTGND